MLRRQGGGVVCSNRATLCLRNLVSERCDRVYFAIPAKCGTARVGGGGGRIRCTGPRVLSVKAYRVPSDDNGLIGMCSGREYVYSLVGSQGGCRVRLCRATVGRCVSSGRGGLSELVRCTIGLKMESRIVVCIRMVM